MNITSILDLMKPVTDAIKDIFTKRIEKEREERDNVAKTTVEQAIETNNTDPVNELLSVRKRKTKRA